jgi:hypothetical protein
MNRAAESVALPWWRRVGRNPLIAPGAAILVLLNLLALAVAVPPYFAQCDFAHYYVAAQLLLAGQNPYTPFTDEMFAAFGLRHNWGIANANGTPPFLWAVASVAWLPPWAAAAICQAVQVLSLWIILRLTRELLAGRLSRRGWWLLAAGACASAPYYFHVLEGHLELTLAAMTLAAYRWHRQGRHAVACAMVTVAGLAKIFPLFLLPWFVWRSAEDWRGRLRPALAAAGCAAVVVLASGVELWAVFAEAGTAGVQRHTVIPQYGNHSVPGLVVLLNHLLHGGQASASAIRAGWLVAQAAGLALIGLGYGLCLRRRDTELEFCFLSAIMLAGSTLNWAFYFVFLIFPVAATVTRVAAHPTAPRALALAVIILLFNDVGAWSLAPGAGGGWVKTLINLPPLIGLLGFVWLCLAELRGTCRAQGGGGSS